MKYYAGLDVSMKETFICIVDELGKPIFETSIPSDPFEIAKVIRKQKFSLEKVGIESGSISNWLTNQLIALEIPAVCVDSRHMSAILSAKINKTDKNDARGIANAMRCDLYKVVVLKTREDVGIEVLLTARRTLVQQRTTIKNTIRGLMKSYGIRLSPIVGNKKFLTAVRNILKNLSSVVQISLETLLVSMSLGGILCNKGTH